MRALSLPPRAFSGASAAPRPQPDDARCWDGRYDGAGERFAREPSISARETGAGRAGRASTMGRNTCCGSKNRSDCAPGRLESRSARTSRHSPARRLRSVSTCQAGGLAGRPSSRDPTPMRAAAAACGGSPTFCPGRGLPCPSPPSAPAPVPSGEGTTRVRVGESTLQCCCNACASGGVPILLSAPPGCRASIGTLKSGAVAEHRFWSAVDERSSRTDAKKVTPAR